MVFRVIGMLLLLLLVFLTIASLLFPKEYHIERSIHVLAPKEVIWKNVSTFSNFQRWNPWKDVDPNMHQAIDGIDGTVGATYSWNGNTKAGAGQQTYTVLQPMELVELDVHLNRPVKIQSTMMFLIKESTSGYLVTWAVENELSYPYNAIFKLFINPSDIVEDDFKRGLLQLKQLCEQEARKDKRVK